MREEPAFEHVSLTPSVAGRRVSELRSYADLVRGVAELLRGDYKQADYGKLILPLVLMEDVPVAVELRGGGPGSQLTVASVTGSSVGIEAV
jgi:hypothetical protein